MYERAISRTFKLAGFCLFATVACSNAPSGSADGGSGGFAFPFETGGDNSSGGSGFTATGGTSTGNGGSFQASGGTGGVSTGGVVGQQGDGSVDLDASDNDGSAGSMGSGGSGGHGHSDAEAPIPTDGGQVFTNYPDGGLGEGVWGGPVPAPTKVGCITSVTAGFHNFPCAVGLDQLTYDVDVPSRCLTEQCGLIFDVHGGTMTGAEEEENTNLSVLGAQYGFIVVHPNANAGLWYYAVDDPGVYQFMLDMQKAFHTNPDRLHMTGLSQGGYMTWRFICEHTDILASAAPAAAAGAAAISPEVGCTFQKNPTPAALITPNYPSRELDILYMHGHLDGLVAFANGVTLRGQVTSFYNTDKGTKIAGDSTYTRTRFTEAGGHVFEFLEHDYHTDAVLVVALKGHCFPGSIDQPAILPANRLLAFGCVPPNSFNWGEEVMKFFLEHPRRLRDN